MVLFAPFRYWPVCIILWSTGTQSYNHGLSVIFGKSIICDKFVPESSCCCFSSLGGSYNSLHILHKVVSYDQNSHSHLYRDFLLSKSPCGLTPEDKLLAMGRALPYPAYPWTSSSAHRFVYGVWHHPPGLANRIIPSGPKELTGVTSRVWLESVCLVHIIFGFPLLIQGEWQPGDSWLPPCKGGWNFTDNRNPLHLNTFRNN